MSNKISKIYTDFADEMIEKEIQSEEYDHIEKSNQNIISNYITIHKQENSLQKPVGEYISVSFQNLYHHEVREDAVDAIVENLETLSANMRLDLHKILVVGLGNRTISSDALGPKVISDIFVTSHLFRNQEEIEGTRDVAAIQTGVMGQTGLESTQIVQSIAKAYQPDLIIAIDALSTRNIERINRVIQITNIGIQPGSGVGNYRKTLNEETLEIPVISIGVATVTSVGALLSEALKEQTETKQQVFNDLKEKELLNFMVTVKSMDEDVRYLANIISESINRFCHPNYEEL